MHEDFFCNTTTKENGNFFQHLVLVHIDAVVFRQLPCQAKSMTTRHNRNFMNRIGFRQELGDDGMAGFMISRVGAFLVTHDEGFAFRSHQDLVLGVFEILHFNQPFVAAGGKQGRFIHEIGQIGTGKARSTTSQNAGIDVRRNRYLAHMDVQDLFTATDIRQADDNLSVETARTQQGFIQYV